MKKETMSLLESIQTNLKESDSSLKHSDMTNKMLSKFNFSNTSTFDDKITIVGQAMNKVSDIVVDELSEMDPEAAIKFLDITNKEYHEAEDSDFSIVNGVYFDWKELSKPEVLDEFIDLALKCMTTKESREELESRLLNI